MKRCIPSALTIAGSDSGGGAGIQADLKTFASLGVHGTSAVVCLTAQNPDGVSGVEPVAGNMVRRQLDAVFAELPPSSVKTGMLFNSSILRAIVDRFSQKNVPPLVVDPVMVATSGAVLLKPAAIKVLINELLPLATLVTPNLDETEMLLRHPVRTLEALREAAREIYDRFGCAALVKGGHLETDEIAVDFFYDGKTELLLSAPRVRGVSTHGTGCTYSAAVTGYLALGLALPDAVARAKQFVSTAIAESVRVGRHWVLNPMAAGRSSIT